MRYLSVCSGIEAATAAWHPLGWKPVAFSEIEPFPSAVLAHHYPDVPNLGDMTRYREWDLGSDVDVLVGGTPCQSFSVAGLRKGLDDPRGNLALVFLGIADRFGPRWVVWENVPGVLSSNRGRDFGAFLGGLGELGYGWAYRVLDAQYIRVESHPRAVPQRRRRVFVVGYLGDWRRAASVLFERESLSGHPAPRRTAGEGAASRTGTSFAFSSHAGAADADVSNRSHANGGPTGTGVSEELAYTLRGGRTQAVAPALTGSGRGVERVGESRGQDPVVAVAHTLPGEGFDASEDGTGRGTPLIPTVANPLTARMAKGINTTLDEEQTPIVFDTTQITSKLNRSNPQPGDPCHPLAAGAHPSAVAFKTDQDPESHGDVCPTLQQPSPTGGGQPTAVMHNMAVRRLTPRECERLQGFQDDFTAIPWKGKPASECPDGHRYRALGNSMAVNVMRWIGQRVQLAEVAPSEVRARRSA